MVRPKLFVDSDICIKAANGSIPPAEWRRVQRYISTHYRYYISWVTWKELLVGISRGCDAWFEQNKERLQVLFRPASRRILPYPSVFALRTVLGIENVARITNSKLTEEQEIEAVFKAVIDAPSKAQLKNGIRARTRKNLLCTFDFDDFDTHENAPQNEYAKLLQGLREGKTDPLERKSWAAWILHECGLTPYTEACEKLALALDAAYCFTLSLSKTANDKGYNFKKHASDWGDNLQLFYLCDESMHFLTMDRDFRVRTKDSPQSSRILTYQEFVESTIC